MLPLVMVDSGNQISNGYVDFHGVYQNMVETSLARPAEAEIGASWWRSGDQVELLVEIKNLRPTPLENAWVVAIVYEENHIKVTNRFGRAEVVRPVSLWLPNEVRTIIMTSDPLTGVDWDKLRVVVLVEYYHEDEGAYDMLQAAPAMRVAPSLSVSPESLTFLVDPDDVDDQEATVQVLGGGFAEWTATTDRPWLRIAPTTGNLLGQPQVTIDKSALNPGWQQGAVTFTATDAAFSDTVAVRAYLGEVKRLYVPVTIR